MALPFGPPVPPMLARLERSLPEGDGFVFEPKWDGFRCLAFRDGDHVDLRSRHDRPLGRYFPELVSALRHLSTDRFAIDGEIVMIREGRTDFEALMSRLHPAASRAERLARELPATYVAFDLLAVNDRDLRRHGFASRREHLGAVLRDAPARVVLTPATSSREEAATWLARRGDGIDGVVAKRTDLTYQPGRRAMIKVKTVRTADCVVAGYRPYPDSSAVSTLLLGLYDVRGELVHVGVVQALPDRDRLGLVEALAPWRVPLGEHPWANGFLIDRSPLGRLKGSAARWTPDMELDWVPLRPERVVEVAYDQADGLRFRHPARLVRWRDDREASSCTTDQLEEPATAAPTTLSA
jgi:ATP-dependent DNA ligase